MNYPYPGYVPSFDPPEPDYLRRDDPPEPDEHEDDDLDSLAFGPWATAGELMRF